MTKSSSLKYTALAAVLLSCATAQASIISDYNKATAASSGWTIVYQGGYGAAFNYSAVLNAIASGSRVALASSSSNSATTYDLFAATSLAMLQTITDYNATIFADGAYWYRNNSSVGFAPNATISQTSADTVGSAFDNYSGSGADLRLSWHGGSGDVYGGWRSGVNQWLNSDYTWQRYVLVGQSINQDQGMNVPEPASLVLIGVGIAGLAANRRRKHGSRG